MAGGIAVMKYTVKLTTMIGPIDFAERYLTAPLAGTYTWWRIVGFLMIVGALLWMGGFLSVGPIGAGQ